MDGRRMSKRYKIESETSTKPIRIECIDLIIPLTDKTGKWNNEAIKWFYRCARNERK